jgi:hypothetical protein
MTIIDEFLNTMTRAFCLGGSNVFPILFFETPTSQLEPSSAYNHHHDDEGTKKKGSHEK